MPTINLSNYGPFGSTSADTTAFRNAIKAAANGILLIQGGSYSLESIAICTPIKIVAMNTKITPAQLNGNVFEIQHTSDVTIEGLWFDASGLGGPKAGFYAIQLKGARPWANASVIERVTIRNCRFTNFGPIPFENRDDSNVIAHALWAVSADHVTFEHNQLDTISGFGVAFTDCRHTHVRCNSFHDTGWASIHFSNRNFDYRIVGNLITGSAPKSHSQGGFIDIQGSAEILHPSGALTVPDKDIYIAGNVINGLLTYGAAIRLDSVTNVVVEGNTLGPLTAPLINQSVIAVTTRQHQPHPCNNVTIRDNILIACGMATQIAIYAQNLWPVPSPSGGYLTVPPAIAADGLFIRNNQIISPDQNNVFTGAVWVHGMTGGWENVVIDNNDCWGTPVQTAALPGFVALASFSPTVLVANVFITNNRFAYGWLGSTVAAPNFDNGVCIYENTGSQNVTVADNTYSNFNTNVYT